MDLYTGDQCWAMARALDDRIEELLDAAASADTDARRHVLATRVTDAVHAQNWLDTMSTYTHSEDAIISLPGKVRLQLDDAGVRSAPDDSLAREHREERGR